MVADEDDDRLVGQAVGFELPEDEPELAIEFARGVEVIARSSRATGRSGLLGGIFTHEESARLGADRPVCLLD